MPATSTRTATFLYLALWTSVILMVGILPLRNFVGHSHWEYIKWLPMAEDLRSPAYLLDIATDMIANTLLFLPFGFLLSRLLPASGPFRRLLIVAMTAGALSLGIELYQVYCHNRVPSLFDLLTNVSGTLLGHRVSVAKPTLLQLASGPRVTPIPPDRTPAP